MPEPTYKIRRILKKTAAGVTQSSYCTLDAILKFDNTESSFCVYNEHVSLRLVQTFHIPVSELACNNSPIIEMASGGGDTTATPSTGRTCRVSAVVWRLPHLAPPCLLRR